MANAKEVLSSIRSIQDTMKITNAMYLISSSKLRRARLHLAAVSDYFATMQATIHDILLCTPSMEHIYLHDASKAVSDESKRAYVVITADKGLAGAYNQSIIKLAEAELLRYHNARLYVVGQVGRRYFARKTEQLDETFLYSAQNPNMQRARSITLELIERYRNGEIDEVYVIYTKMLGALQAEPRMLKLLPLDRQDFKSVHGGEQAYHQMTSFYPSADSVMNKVAPIYTCGILFGALTESYCAELNARMTAMDAATKNADEMIEGLRLLYNSSRQAAITQEITEIVAGAKAFKRKKARKGESL